MEIKPTIMPCLWYDIEAKEAVDLYTSIFPNSRITNKVTIPDTPSGEVPGIDFELTGQPFMAISAGPLFKLTPSISFTVIFDDSHFNNPKASLDTVWKALVDGGNVLMPLDSYSFSKRYGWLQDKYGLSWQLFLADDMKESDANAIIPTLLFAGDNRGNTKSAIDFYLTVFENATLDNITLYPKAMSPEKESDVMYATVTIGQQPFIAMDSNQAHDFTFNEAVSLVIKCETQEEIDDYWDKLSAVPKAEECGWLKDPYGISWQIVPKEVDDMMENGTSDQLNRLFQAMFSMKKLYINDLRKAYNG